LLKITAVFDWRSVYFVSPLEYIVKKDPVPTERATGILVKFK